MDAVERNKKKARARAAYLVKIGLKKPPAQCQLCERSGQLEKHHPDYTKPDDFLWWCICCHRRFHRRFSRRTVFELFPSTEIIDYCTKPENRPELEKQSGGVKTS